MSKEIISTFVEINGRKVPYQIIPPGYSGLTPEAREALDMRMKIKGHEDDDFHGINLRLKDKVDRYLNDGEDEDGEVTEYIESIDDASFEASDAL